MRTEQRPAADESDPFYHGYINTVPAGEIVELLASQLDREFPFLASIPEDRADHRYEEGKWSTKEVVGHMVDAEWIFTYRALWIARGDQTPMPGMDQDEFVRNGNFDQRTLKSLTDEFTHLRRANLEMFRSFNDEVLDRRGTASGCPFTVRALLYIIAGHALHHVGVLRDRYL